MVRLRRRWPLPLLLVLSLLGCALASARPPASTPPLPSSAPDLEQRIHEQINRYRDQQGLPRLRYDPRIAEIARGHSRAMVTGERPFGHAGMPERTRAIAAILPVRRIAENVAYNSRTGDALVESVVTGWIRNPGHRANLAGAYDLTGVGLARAADGPYYVTQIFVEEEG